jgi:hypothetical protein
MRLATSISATSVLALVLAGGCQNLDPLVSDDPGASIYVLPAGTQVPHVSSSEDLTRQIRINDGLNDMALTMSMGVLPLKTAWSAGQPVVYWDFGDAPQAGALLYVLVRRNADDTYTPIDHPFVADSIPGDKGYSPFWLVQNVVVTDKYQGEILPSDRAIADAVDLGLVEEPFPSLQWVDGPIVAQGTLLDTGKTTPPLTTTLVYANGYFVDMFILGGSHAFQTFPMGKAGRMIRGDAPQIWLGGAVSASKEPVFQFAGTPWLPFVRPIECHVTMPADPMDPSAKVHDEAQLFTRDMMGALLAQTDRVWSWKPLTSTKNWPLYLPEVP